MKAENNKPVDSVENQHAGQKFDKSRRSFAKAGAITPVIITLANRPAWGSTRTFCSVSGFNSGRVVSTNVVSGAPVHEICGTNISHGYWYTHTGLRSTPAAAPWPAPYCPATPDSSCSGGKYDAYVSGMLKTCWKTYLQLQTLENQQPGSTIFTVNKAFGVSTHSNMTLFQAIDSNSGGSTPWLWHMTAALLNAKSGNFTGLGDANQVIAIFQALDAGGASTYTFPGTNITWTKQNMIDYLTYLFGG